MHLERDPTCLPFMEFVKLEVTTSRVVEGSSNARLHSIKGCFMVKAPWLGALVDQGSTILGSSDRPIAEAEFC